MVSGKEESVFIPCGCPPRTSGGPRVGRGCSSDGAPPIPGASSIQHTEHRDTITHADIEYSRFSLARVVSITCDAQRSICGHALIRTTITQVAQKQPVKVTGVVQGDNLRKWCTANAIQAELALVQQDPVGERCVVSTSDA